MAIEKQAADKQKALNGSSAQGLISIKEVTALCDRHHSHIAEAPVQVAAFAGAEIHTAEAVRIFQTHYPAIGCELQGDSSRDLPQLPDRM